MLGDPYTISGAATPELFHKFIMNTSAEMSKASRRKQSKPNRLLANEDMGAQQVPAHQGPVQQVPALDMHRNSPAAAVTSPKVSPDPAQVLEKLLGKITRRALLSF